MRQEIVSLHLGEDDINPAKFTAKRVTADELHDWLQKGEVTVVDMRNDYEFKVGRFANSVFLGLKNFRDLKSEVAKLAPLKNKKVVTVCTGGVRCEKASGYLLKQGFEDVYQLDGGIVSYIEKYPNQGFKGTLYVFDRRITMDFDPPDNHTVISQCELCEAPSERFVNCKNPKCNKHFIACESCAEELHSAFCTETCRDKLVVAVN